MLPPTIVMNCPRCGKRHEVDGLLAGKKSKCKVCGEVFSIPVPSVRTSESAPAPKPAEPIRSIAPKYWASVLNERTSSLKGARAAGSAEIDEELPPPPRLGYRRPRESYRRKSRPSGVNVGPIIGWFLGLSFATLIGMLIWISVNGYTVAEGYRLGVIFNMVFLCGCAALSLWGYAWIVSLAFQEDSMQGVMCLFVPFYFIYYAATHWEECNGPFALGITGLGIPIALVVVAVALPALNQSRLKNRSAGPSGGDGANRELVRQAEETVKENIHALDNFTNQLTRIKDAKLGGQSGRQLLAAVRRLQFAESRGRLVKVRNIELVYLKHSVGPRMRGSLAALKQEMARIEAIPGFRGIFEEGPSELDKSIDFWTIKPGEETPPQLVDGPALPIGPGPGGGSPPGGSRWGPPGQSGTDPTDPNPHYQRMLAEHGAKAITVVFFGLPTNGDPARGVTTRDVSEALNERLKRLAPSATSWLSMSIDSQSALVLAPVDDARSRREHQLRQGHGQGKSDRCGGLVRIHRHGSPAAGRAQSGSGDSQTQ